MTESFPVAIHETAVDSWPEARSRLLAYAAEKRTRRDSDGKLDTFLEGRRWIYRGVRDCTWALESSFERYWGKVSTAAARGRVHRTQLDELKFAIAAHLPDFKFVERDAEVEAFGQHYGLPTLLLDWSRNPLCAAYFACSDPLLNGDDLSSKLAVWALRTDALVWSNQQHCVEIVSALSGENQRAVKQMGLFTYDRSGQTSLEDYVRGTLDDKEVQKDLEERGPILVKVVFPQSVVIEALEELDLFGINSFTMFPDHQGLVRGARERIMRTRSG